MLNAGVRSVMTSSQTYSLAYSLFLSVDAVRDFINREHIF